MGHHGNGNRKGDHDHENSDNDHGNHGHGNGNGDRGDHGNGDHDNGNGDRDHGNGNGNGNGNGDRDHDNNGNHQEVDARCKKAWRLLHSIEEFADEGTSEERRYEISAMWDSRLDNAWNEMFEGASTIAASIAGFATAVAVLTF